MIKIVHLINTLDFGGAERMLQRLATAMDDKVFETLIISLTGQNRLAAELEESGVRVKSLGVHNAFGAPLGIIKLFIILRRERPDILMSWLHLSDLIGALTGWLAGVKSIIWNLRCSDMGADYYRGRSGLMLKVLARLSPYVDAITVNSQAGRSRHSELGYSPKNWLYIPNGVDAEIFHPDGSAGASLKASLGLSPNSPVIGLVARYAPIKDHNTLLQAAQIILEEKPDVHFVLVGLGVDDGNRALREKILALGIGDNVHLLGERSDIATLTAGFDIATCCSLSEGFPSAISEAMACGVPCVSTDAGDAAQIMGGLGAVVQQSDSKAFADACLAILSLPPAERSALSKKVRQRIQDEFEIAAAVKRYQQVFRRFNKSAAMS